jgi:hypothetical protein
MDQLLNLLGKMMRMPLDMMTAGAGWISQTGHGMQPQAGAPSPTSRWPSPPANAGQPASPGTAAGPGAGAGAAPSRQGRMQVLVVFEVFDTIVEPRRFQQAVTQTHDQLNRIFASGAAVASGAFTSKRGGFVLLNVASGEELLQLMAPGLSDNCTIETWPVLPFDQQTAVLQQIGVMKP